MTFSISPRQCIQPMGRVLYNRFAIASCLVAAFLSCMEWRKVSLLILELCPSWDRWGWPFITDCLRGLVTATAAACRGNPRRWWPLFSNIYNKYYFCKENNIALCFLPYWNVPNVLCCTGSVLTLAKSPGVLFNIKMPSQYRKSYCGEKTISRPSYLHKGIFYAGKMTSLYWIKQGPDHTRLGPSDYKDHQCPTCDSTDHLRSE